MSNYTTGNPVFTRFFDKLPDYPHCTDKLEAGCRQAPKHVAVKRRYIQPNKPNYSHAYLNLDCDYAGVYYASRDLDLPAATLCVSNRNNGRGHLDFELSTPVHLGGNASSKAIRYLDVIRRGLTRAFYADASFSGFLTKNPLSDFWQVSTWDVTYTLDELAEALREIPTEVLRSIPADEWDERIKSYDIPLYDKKPSRKPRIISTNPDDSLFVYHNTRWYAYTITVDCKRHGQLLDRIEAYIRKLNRDFGLNLAESQIRSDARSIAKWCWNHRVDFIAKRNAFCALQQNRAYRSHKARKRNTATKINYARRKLRKEGKIITKSAIAEVSGISVQSLAKRNLKTDLSEIRSGNAHQTAEIKRAATEAKIKQAIDTFLREGRKITKSAIAKEAGISREAASRYYAHLFPKV